MICPRCESLLILQLANRQWWCRTCDAPFSTAMFCAFRFGDETCGAHPEPGETCNKTVPECRRKLNLARFGGMVAP